MVDFRRKKEPLPWKKMAFLSALTVLIIGFIVVFLIPRRPQIYKKNPTKYKQEVKPKNDGKKISFVIGPGKINPDLDFKKWKLYLRLNTVGHSSAITNTLIYQEGNKLLSCSRDKTVKIWDISDVRNPFLYSTIRGRMSLSSGQITSISNTGDWKFLAVATETQIRLYDLTKGEIIKIFGTEKKISHFVLSADGDVVAYSTIDNDLVIFYKRVAGYSKHEPVYLWERKIISNYQTPITSLAITQNRLAVALNNGIIKLLDTKNKFKLTKLIQESEERINVVKFSNNGEYLIAGADNNSVLLYDKNGESKKELVHLDSPPRYICLSPDDKFILIADDIYYSESTLRIFSFPDGTLIKERTHPVKLSSMSSGLLENKVIWGLADNHSNTIMLMDNQGEMLSRITGIGNTANALKFNQNQKVTFTSHISDEKTGESGPNNIKYQLDLKTLELSPFGDETEPTQPHSRTGDYFLESYAQFPFNTKIHGPEGMINVKKGDRIVTRIIQGCLTQGIHKHILLIKNKLIATGGKNGVINIYNIEGKLIGSLVGHEGDILSLASAQDGKWLASSSKDRTIKLWSLQRFYERRNEKTLDINIFYEKLKKKGFHEEDISNLQDKLSKYFLTDTIMHDALLKYMFIPFSSQSVVNPYLSIFTAGDDWLMWTPEGYFASSSNKAMAYVGHHMNWGPSGRFLSIQQVFDKYFRPDMLKLKFDNHKHYKYLIHSEKDDFLNQMLIFSPPPEIEILSPKNGEEFEKNNIKIKINLKDIGGGIGDIRLYHNGKLAFSQNVFRTKKASKPSAKAVFKGEIKTSEDKKFHRQTGDIEKTIDLELIPGVNEISIQALNYKNNIKSALESIKVNCSNAIHSNKLFLLAVGIQNFKERRLNLRFPHYDVRDISDLIKAKNKKYYEDIIIKKLFDPGKQKIMETFYELKKVMFPSDTFIFCISTHGALKDDVYHLITADCNGKLSEDSSICGHELMKLSKDIPALKQIFILDTCHAGAIDWKYSDLYENRLMGISLGSGLNILYASTPYRFAMEGHNLHGFFSFAIIEALKGKADENGDRKVTLSELGRYVKKTVKSISRGFQNPVLSIVSKNIIISEI